MFVMKVNCLGIGYHLPALYIPGKIAVSQCAYGMLSLTV